MSRCSPAVCSLLSEGHPLALSKVAQRDFTIPGQIILGDPQDEPPEPPKKTFGPQR